jgi:hypothetical protein
METVLQLWSQRLIILFLIILTATIALSPLASNMLVPNGADLLNHLSAIIQAKTALAEGQFPIRVAPFLHSGWRYPFYQFYSPTAYLVAGIMFMLTPTNPLVAFKLTVLLASIAGGIYMYRLANLLVNSKYIALLASVSYMTSPYYLIVLDHFYDFTEAIGLGVLPITLFYSVKLFYFPKNLHAILLMAISWYLLATVHLITFFYTFVFLAFLLIVFTIRNPRYWRNLLTVGGGFIFAMGLCAWHFVPIYQFRQFLNVENYYGLDPALNYYETNFTSLFSPIANILPISTKAGELTNAIFKIHPNVGLVFLFAMLASVYIFIRQKKINSIGDTWLLPLIITSILIVSFVWSPFKVWPLMPRIFTVGQYSWRLMSQVAWVGALLFAISGTWLFPPETLTKKNMLLGCLCVIFSTATWYIVPDLGFTYPDFSHMIHVPSFAVSDETYLLDPGAVTRHSFDKNDNPLPVMALAESKKFCHQDKDITKCSIPASAYTKMIELPILYYPKLLSVTVNGKKVSYQGMIFEDKLLTRPTIKGVTHEYKLLTAITSTPSIVNDIDIKFVGLPFANRISSLGWYLWIILFLYQATVYCVSRFSRKQELTLCVK